jgi:response regulator RpfG family c-di-GMP phosphodiesterase
MKYNILIVDDEQANLRLLNRLLSADYNVILADSGAAGLEVLEKQQVALIISDQRMPGMTGIEFLKRAAAMAPQIVRIIITGYTDAEALGEAVNSGVVYKYVTKPWINSDLKITIQRGLQHHETQRAQRNLQERYTKALAETDEAKSSFRNFVETILQLQDPIGHGRAVRVNKLAVELAQKMELPPAEIEQLQLAIFVRAILNTGAYEKTNTLVNSVDHALRAVRKFEAGIKLISEVPVMREVATSIRQFNERYDGSGYPSRLSGENIMPIARIGAIVMAYDEMTIPHNDKPRIQPIEAADNIRNAAGTKFDPRMVEAFCELINESNSVNAPHNSTTATQPAVSFV